ncbi:hypothetical protein [Moorena sp. SIO3A5]|nr:hypothetical protein [Moorena sp. SIO3A5]NEQ05056.1 hypothetical protein [Moorena sp. SIO4E2]
MANRNPPLTPTRRGRAGDGSVIGGNSGRKSDRHIWRNLFPMPVRTRPAR